MAREVSAIIGSGTEPFTYKILPTSARGETDSAAGVRTGTQVMLGNPEDLNSVPAFVSSGIGINVTPVLIWGPQINTLPRQREIVFYNRGAGDAMIGRTIPETTYGSGLFIPSGGSLTLPLMHNVEIWAKGTAYAEITFVAY